MMTLKNPKEEHIVFENFHEAIIDKRVFEIAQKNRAARTRRHYNGTKKFSNAYSGVLYCGDCGHPMYPMSRRDLKEAYHCGAMQSTVSGLVPAIIFVLILSI